MSKYSKNLSGQNLRAFVANATAYTDDTSYANFIANAAEGEIGVFLSSGTVQTAALSSGDEFFIAQKRDSFVSKTPILKYDELFSAVYTAYDAPVKQVSHIGYNTSANDIGFNFTSASSTNTLTFELSVRETTPGNQPFPVQEGYATVKSTTADEYTVLATMVSQLNGDFDYERTQPDRFVKAEIVSDGALTTTGVNAVVVNGSTKVTFASAVTIAAGVFLSIAGTIYKVATGVTAGTILYIDRPYQGASATVTAGATSTTIGTMAYTSGTNKLGVKFTAIENECHFIVAPFTGLVNDTVTSTTAWKQGSGSGTSIQDLEKESIIFEGVGSTVNAAFRDDYGYPTLFASSTATYNQIFLNFAPRVLPAAALPFYEQKQIQRIVLAAPSSGTTPSSDLRSIFGV
jgi:hypothetical protein